MKVFRYRPAFFEGFESNDDIKTFNTKEELLAVPWISQWSTPANNDDVFSGYFISRNHLMAAYNYNTSREPIWWVIANFKDEDIDTMTQWFPKWDDPEYVMKNGDVIDVVSSCGGNIEYVKNGNRTEKFSGTQEWLYANMEMNRFPRVTFK